MQATKALNLHSLLNSLLNEQMRKRYDVVKTQFSDGEIHLILIESKPNDAPNNTSDLNETKIKEIMKKEAQKPLHLIREYE